MILMAFDPGKTTGVCVADVSADNFQVTDCFEILWSHRFAITKALISGTYYNARVPRLPDFVVAESFRLRQGKALSQTGSDFPSVQVIAIIQTYLYMYARAENGHELLKLQDPHMRVKVKVMNEDKSWVLGSPHRKDAYQHARLFWAKNIKEY